MHRFLCLFAFVLGFRQEQEYCRYTKGGNCQNHRPGVSAAIFQILTNITTGNADFHKQGIHQPIVFGRQEQIADTVLQNGIIGINDLTLGQLLVHIIPGTLNGRAVADVIHIGTGDFRGTEEVDE